MDYFVWPRPSARTRTVGAEVGVARPSDAAVAVTVDRAADARLGDDRVPAAAAVVGRGTPAREDVVHVVEVHIVAVVVTVAVAASHHIGLEVVHVIGDADGLSHALVKTRVAEGLVPLAVVVVRHRHLCHDGHPRRLWHDAPHRRLCHDARLHRVHDIDAQDRVASVRDVSIRRAINLVDAVVDMHGVVSSIAGPLTIAVTTTITTTMVTTK